jgi:hypothetical protein
MSKVKTGKLTETQVVLCFGFQIVIFPVLVLLEMAVFFFKLTFFMLRHQGPCACGV